jgi:hypothetical protein
VGHQGWGKTRWKGGRRWREVARHRGSTGSAVGEQRGAVAPDGVARERSSNGHLTQRLLPSSTSSLVSLKIDARSSGKFFKDTHPCLDTLIFDNGVKMNIW